MARLISQSPTMHSSTFMKLAGILLNYRSVLRQADIMADRWIEMFPFIFVDVLILLCVIDRGLKLFSIFFSVICYGQFTYLSVSWLSHTITPHYSFPKQLAAFPHKTVSQLLEEE